MIKSIKKVTIGMLVAALMVSNVAMAAEESPVTAKLPKKYSSAPAQTSTGIKATVATTASGTATIKTVKTTAKKVVKIPAFVTVKGVKYKVTTVAAKAFKKCKKVKDVKLPSTIKKVKKGAFTGCKAKYVTFRNTKTFKVEKGAFKGCNTKKMIAWLNASMPRKDRMKMVRALKKANFKGEIWLDYRY